MVGRSRSQRWYSSAKRGSRKHSSRVGFRGRTRRTIGISNSNTSTGSGGGGGKGSGGGPRVRRRRR
eukprot:3260443-Prorocentrum_lima.AAC.1